MLLTNTPAAEDAVQDAFAGLLRLRMLPHDVERYLRASVRNACYSRLRWRLRWTGMEEPLLEAIDPSREADDDRLALERALRRLSVEQREVVHLHVFEGHTFREIAAIVGVSMNTVMSRYRYALARLREVLS